MPKAQAAVGGDPRRIEKFTDAWIAKEAKLLEGKPQTIYWERELKGFGLVVGRKTKTFIVQRSVNNRDVRRKVAVWGPKQAAEARALAHKMLGQLHEGVDPLVMERREKRQGITLQEALDLYMAREDIKPVTKNETEKVIKRHLGDWLDRPLVELGTDEGREEVVERHAGIAASVAKRHAKAQKEGKYVERDGKASANAAMVAFTTVWKQAMKRSSALPVPPTIAINKYKTKPKRDPIAADDLPKWHAAVVAYAKTNKEKSALVRVALFAGLRSSDARTMRWEHVDLKRKVLRIPNPSKRRATDANEPRDLPLSRQLVAMLTQRKREHDEAIKKKLLPPQAAPWVFGAASTPGHVIDPRVPVPGIKYRMHSTRHTFRDVAEYHAGLDVPTIGALMDHKEGRTAITYRYGRANVIEHLYEPMQKVSDALDALIAGKPKAKRGRK